MPMGSGSEETGAGGAVGLDLVDALLADVAGVLHDKPVQSLVAAKLMLQAASGGPDDPMAARGMDALDRAATLSRDVMWALDRRPPGEDLRTSLVEMLDRGGDPEHGVEVTVAADVHAAQARPLLAAVQDLVVDAVLPGGAVREVVVEESAEVPGTIVATVATDAGPDRVPGLWVDLATQRVTAAGGTLVVDVAEDGRRTQRITLPAPA